MQIYSNTYIQKKYGKTFLSYFFYSMGLLFKVLPISRIGPHYMETKEAGKEKLNHEVKRSLPRDG